MNTVLTVVQILFYVIGAAAAIAAVWQYIHADQHRVAETVLKLEERFRELGPILRRVDPHAGLSDALVQALDASLDGSEKTDEQRDLIRQFDELLRFFLLLSHLHARTFLGREAPVLYRYWLTALYAQPTFWRYINRYFPTIITFVENGRSVPLLRKTRDSAVRG